MAKIAFIQRDDYELLSVGYMSAVLRAARHETTVVCQNREKDIPALLKVLEPDILAFTAMTVDYPILAPMARQMKQLMPQVHVIFGGVHATFNPEIIHEDYVDAVCRGEGEYPLLEYADQLERRGDGITRICNLWVKEKGHVFKNDVRDLLQDLDDLPFPDHAVYFSRYPDLRTRYNRFFMAGRGCPFRCSYCFNSGNQKLHEGKGRYVRRCSPGRLIEQIKDARASSGVLPWINFVDDVFAMNKEWLRTFIPLYRKEIDVPFMCFGKVETLDEETVRLLKEGGCDKLRIGIEHGNEDFRRNVLNRNYSNAEVLKVANLLHKYGIRFQTYNISGWPEETPEQAFDTIRLNQAVRPAIATSFFLQPYPGTELYRRFEDRIEACPDASMSYTFPEKTLIKNMHTQTLLNYHYLFTFAVYHPHIAWTIKFLARFPVNRFFKLLYYYYGFVKGRLRHDDRMTIIAKFTTAARILFLGRTP